MKTTIARGILAIASSLTLVYATSAAAQTLPDYYPASYSKIIDDSKKESGLLVYSVMASFNWKPVLESFAKKYPWIKVETLDLNNELWDRYYTEKASGSRTADFIAAFGIPRWLQASERGELLAYDSPEKGHLPAWSNPIPGAYTLSADPALIVWNKHLIPKGEVPDTAEKIAKLADEQKNLAGKFVTYDAGAGAETAIWNWVWTQGHGDKIWDTYAKLGPVSKAERAGGVMLEKLTIGEYALAYLISGITVFPKLDGPAQRNTIGWSFFKDKQPIYPRLMAVTKGGRSPQSARLLLDHVLSYEGQVGFGRGGLTPVRDLKPEDITYWTYHTIVEKVGGEDHIQMMTYDPDQLPLLDAFIPRWRKAFNR
ncbi:ABC transporter substrate-binding protein [Pollutimonas bauzanensis]|uniref:Iron(III) transport system substrate-binding protein n=1 Tax=Pollutimonas bauzanensis TaxID=658167 RepID=A0A1M5UX46_9BURK|nr:extracellular solute-binding protein [Pollutimonas bauzanensis]SHH67466.1 iron(III) transport system substrate-binding protein [Pollutimonas bauzanensis]